MKRWLYGVIVVVVLCVTATAGWLFIRRDKAEPLPMALRQPSAAVLKDTNLIAHGKYLATAAACNICHTSQGGQTYAGGRSVVTPFGDIAAPNLTPDAETGLGQWQFEDFWLALHDGIGPGGKLLYPAFPYTAYTRINPDDALAIFAYLRSLPAVHQTSIRPNLRFP
jgi:mono/diheme cytochrome c family protein